MGMATAIVPTGTPVASVKQVSSDLQQQWWLYSLVHPVPPFIAASGRGMRSVQQHNLLQQWNLPKWFMRLSIPIHRIRLFN